MTPGDIAMMLNETVGPPRADDQPVARRRERAHPGARRPLLADPRRRAPALRRPGGRARAAPDPAAGPRPRGDHQGHGVGAVRRVGARRCGEPALAPAERRGGAHGAREPDLARRHGRRGVPLRAAVGARGDTPCSRAGTGNRAATSTATGGPTCRATSAWWCARASTSTTARGRTAFLTGGITGEDRRRRHAPRARRAGRAAVRRGTRHAARRRGRARALGRAGLGDRRSAARSLTRARLGGRAAARAPLRAVREDDRHRTWFGEAALAVPRGRVTYVGGAAIQQDALPRRGRAGLRLHVHACPRVRAGGRGRGVLARRSRRARALDAHSEYGTFVNPRVSLLFRRPDRGRARGLDHALSVGTGEFAPTPFTEETEATGLTPLAPLAGLVAERATQRLARRGRAARDRARPARAERHRVRLARAAPAAGDRRAGHDGERRASHPLVNAPGRRAPGAASCSRRLVRELGEEQRGRRGTRRRCA